jgi:hypothetical protein
MNAKLQGHEELLQQLRQTEETALRLAQKGHKIGNVIQHLRDSEKEIETRIKYFTREEKSPRETAAPKQQRTPKTPESKPPRPAAN